MNIRGKKYENYDISGKIGNIISFSSFFPLPFLFSKLNEKMDNIYPWLKAERAVIDSELRNTNVDIKTTFLSAAAGGNLNEQVLSVQHLDRAYGPLQKQAR